MLHYDSYVESSSKSQDPNKSQLPQVSLKCVEKAHNSFFYLDSNASSTQLVSGGDGRSIVLSDIETGLKPVVRISKAHGSSISAVCWYNDSCVVTGDTRGRIKVAGSLKNSLRILNGLFCQLVFILILKNGTFGDITPRFLRSLHDSLFWG